MKKHKILLFYSGFFVVIFTLILLISGSSIVRPNIARAMGSKEEKVLKKKAKKISRKNNKSYIATSYSLFDLSDGSACMMIDERISSTDDFLSLYRYSRGKAVKLSSLEGGNACSIYKNYILTEYYHEGLNCSAYLYRYDRGKITLCTKATKYSPQSMSGLKKKVTKKYGLNYRNFRSLSWHDVGGGY